MKRFIVFAIFAASLVFAGRAQAQAPPTAFAATGSPHGIKVTWGASQAGSFPLSGYFLWRCTGTTPATVATDCTLTAGAWVQITPSAITPLLYLDPSAGLSTNTGYAYVIQAVDTVGNVSAWSPIVTVAIPSSFPSDATAPAKPTAAVQ